MAINTPLTDDLSGRLQAVRLHLEPLSKAVHRLLLRLEERWHGGLAIAAPLAPSRGRRSNTLSWRPDAQASNFFDYWEQRQPRTWSNADLWHWLLEWAVNDAEQAEPHPISITTPVELWDWIHAAEGYRPVAIATLIDDLKDSLSPATLRSLIGQAYQRDIIELGNLAALKDAEPGERVDDGRPVAIAIEAPNSSEWWKSATHLRALPNTISFSQLRTVLYHAIPQDLLQPEAGILYQGRLRAFLVHPERCQWAALESAAAGQFMTLDLSTDLIANTCSTQAEFRQQLRIALMQIGVEPCRPESAYYHLNPPPKDLVLVTACDGSQAYLARAEFWTEITAPTRKPQPSPGLTLVKS